MTKKIKRANYQRKKFKIRDIPFSTKKNKGTLASSNVIHYNYQNLFNMLDFLYEIHIRDKIKNVDFFKNRDDSVLIVDIYGEYIYPYTISQSEFKKKLHKCLKKRFIPIPINTELPVDYGGTENHANTILIDTKLKNIELFEPHGYKKEESTLSDTGSKILPKIDSCFNFLARKPSR